MDGATAAMIVATVGVVLAAGSLAWQVATHVLTGARIGAELRMGAIDGGKALTWPALAASPPVATIQQLGPSPQLVFAIVVINRGRLAVNVHEPVVVLTGGVAFNQMGWSAVNPDSPFRLEPQSQQTWYVPADPVRSMAESSRATLTSGPIDAWGRVPLGNGKSVETDEKVRVLA